MKATSLILAGLGLASGLVSAWFWWRSSRTTFNIRWVSLVTSGSPVPTTCSRSAGADQLAEISRMINAEKSDVFDVLAYIAFASAPITRSERVDARKGSS
jgi:hypothetical protein